MKHESDDQRRAQEWAQDKKEGNKYTLQEGTNVIRILKTPPDKERNSPGLWIEYRMHGNVGPNKRFVRCGKSISGKGDCWLCKVVDKLRRKGKPKRATALEAIQVVEMAIAVVDPDSGKMRGPKRFYLRSGRGAKSMAYKLMTGIIASRRKDYLNHKKGYNISIERVGTGQFNTTYPVGPTPDDEPSKVPSRIVDDLKPFVDIIPQYDEDQQQNAYYGREDDSRMSKDSKKKKKKREDEDPDEDDEDEDQDEEEEDEEDEEDEDDEDEKSKKKKKGKKSKKSRDEDEDADEEDEEEEEEDEEEEEEEEEEDEKPKKKKGKKSRDDEDEDEEDEDEEEEDEDEDEEEEEEDEKPKKKKKKSKKH
jgi:hypothetical protein